MFSDLKKEIEKPLKEEEEPKEIQIEFSTTKVFSREQLMKLLSDKAKEFSDRDPKRLESEYTKRLMVGTIGYPNVGKSSVINVLCGRKRVGVASLPGKTKHFQTLVLDEELCLCDCPGLVFPSFANSKAEMLTCGVLPIDTIREYISPISLILSRVAKEVLET